MSEETSSLSFDRIEAVKDSIFYGIDNADEGRLLVTRMSKPKSLTPLLDSLISSFPKGKDTIDIRWSLVISSLMVGKPKDDLSGEMAINDFLDSKDPMIAQIKPYINAVQEITPEIAGMLCCYFLLFRDTNNGLFQTMLPELKELIGKIGVQAFFQIAGPETISFFPDPDFKFFSQCPIDPKAIALYFQFPANYVHTDFSLSIQNRVLKEYPYPKFFPQGSSFLSLAHLSIEKDMHFYDILNKFYVDYLMGTNLDQWPENLAEFEDIAPYLLVENQHIIFGNINKYKPLINKDQHNELINEMFVRFGNDEKLMNFISYATTNGESTVKSEDLIKHSFPYLLKNALDNSKLLEWAKLKYYRLSDNDSLIDFDFIRAFNLLQTFLNSCSAPTKTFKNKLQEIKAGIEAIENKNIKRSIILDLFSAIFVKNNDKFICHPFIAQEMCTLLHNYHIAPYITGAMVMFQKSPVKAKEQIKTLETYLNKNPNQVFDEIRAQNWQVAEQMTAFLPYFRKLFARAFTRHLIINKQQLPEPYEKEKTMVSMEIGFSSDESVDFLLQSITQYPKYTKCLQNRIDSITSKTVMSALPGAAKWETPMGALSLTETATIEEIVASNKFQAFLTKIAPSNSLLDFLNYMSLYFQCASLYTGIEYGSINAIFEFDIRRAIAGPYNIGDMNKVHKLTKKYNIDLFDFVLQNMQWFNVNSEFITQTYKEHPLEAIALAAGLSNFEMLSDTQVSLPLTKYISRKNEYERKFDQAEEIGKILDMVKSGSSDFEDTLFTVDHHSLYSRLLLYDHTKFNDSMIKLLNIIDYVAPSDDKDTLDKIRIYNKILKFSSASLPIPIINDLMNNNQFDMSLTFLKRCVPADSRAQPLCHLFSKCVDNGDQMDEIIQNFSSRYDLISSRFFHVPGVLPHLLKCCPPEKRETIKGLSLLPEEVATDSNIFDITTVAEAYGRHKNCIFKMSQETANLFTDSQLLSMINTIEEEIDYYNAFAYIYQFFRGKDSALKLFSDKILKTISSMVIENPQQEIEAIKYFEMIEKPLNIFPRNNPEFKIIRVISELVTFYPHIRYGVKYSFRDISNPEFPRELLVICNIIDRDDIARSLQDAFHIDISGFIVKRIRLQTQIGLIKRIRGEFEVNSFMIDENLEEGNSVDDCIMFLSPLMKAPIFDPQILQLIKKIKVASISTTKFPELHVFQWIKMQGNNPTSATAKGQLCVKFLISHFFTRKMALRLCMTFINPFYRVTSSLKLIDVAYQLLMRLEDENDRVNAFINDLYYYAVTSDMFKSLNKYIMTQDVKMLITKNLWDGLIEYAKQHELKQTMFNIYLVRNMFDEAAITSLELFDQSTVLSQRLSYISHAAYCLNEAIHCRETHTTPEGVPYQPNPAKSIEDLMSLRSMVKFQLDLTQFCTENQVEINDTFDLTKNKQATIKVGAALLMNKAYEILDELTKLSPIKMKDILAQVAVFLAEKELNELLKFLQEFRVIRPDLAQDLQPVLLEAIADSPNHKYLLYLIMTCWQNPEDQCLYFIANDYVAEAFAISSTKNIKHLFPLIAYRASLLGKDDMVENCLKAFSSK